MYNSSIKGQSKRISFEKHIEIPGKVFFNDMSKTHLRKEFFGCDVIYSEIAWPYGYRAFNEIAGNVPNEYSAYIQNVNSLIESLDVPAFIVCGKPAARYFANAKQYPIRITTSRTNMDGCQLYVWNWDATPSHDTDSLTDYLAEHFNKCLDPSCGYGEHLMKFKDFVACDINRDCLTYLSILVEEANHGKTKN